MFRFQRHNLIIQFFVSKRCSYATEAKFETKPFRLHRLEAGPAPEVVLRKEEALTMYERMSTIRKMEATINALYKRKIIRGFCHLYSGMEGVAVGVFQNLLKQDTAITTYRNHAWSYLLDKCSVYSTIAELVGVQSGCSRGKGGSMHMYHERLWGGNAIVGAQVPVGVGVALSYKYRNMNAICVTIYGDGASNNGQVYEAYNMAKLWDVPCLFLCENNQYSMGTSIPRSTPNPDFYTKGDYVPGIWVDGMDVISVKEAARFAVEYIRSGKGPLVLEGHSYRYSGHSLSDPGTTYRTRAEVQEMRKNNDPIKKFKKRIVDAGLVTEDELKNLSKKIKNLIDEETKKALSDKPIGVEELTCDIYANEIIKEVRGVTPFKPWVHRTLRHTIK